MIKSTVNTEESGFDRQRMEKRLAWLERATRLLDDQFVIPGTNFRFGLDPLLGLFPGLGDIISYVISALIVLFSLNYSGDMSLFWRMMFNILIDVLAGYIPVVGDMADFAFKANRRNMILLRQHLGLPEVSSREKANRAQGKVIEVNGTVDLEKPEQSPVAGVRPVIRKRAAVWVFLFAFFMLLVMLILMILGGWKLASLIYGFFTT